MIHHLNCGTMQEVTDVDGRRRKASQERPRERMRTHAGTVRTGCSHDHVELGRERSRVAHAQGAG